MSARWGQTLCHAQYHNDVRGGQGLGKGWEIGVGARTGCLGALPSVRGQEARWMLELRPMYRWPSQQWTQTASAGVQVGITAQTALRLNWQAEWRDADQHTLSLSWLRYF